jgi:hypothetical protein
MPLEGIAKMQTCPRLTPWGAGPYFSKVIEEKVTYILQQQKLYYLTF